MATLTLQDASAGLDQVVFTAADVGGDQVPQGSRAAAWDLGVVLLVDNGDTGAHTVTVAAHPPVVVPAGALAVIPVYGAARESLRAVTYDAVTAVAVAAVSLAG